jgi:hypothetical protein
MQIHDVEFNLFEVLAIISAIIIPLTLWGYKLQATLKRLVDLHEHGSVESILDEHSQLLGEMHKEHTVVVANLGNCIAELSHYIKWLGSQQTGRQPPPFVRDIK